MSGYGQKYADKILFHVILVAFYGWYEALYGFYGRPKALGDGKQRVPSLLLLS